MRYQKVKSAKRSSIPCIAVLSIALLIAGGCGGSGSDQHSSMNLDIAILDVEGAYLIQGVVFNDINGDEVKDVSEPGIPDVPVALVGVEDTVTDSTGMYSFSVTVARAYTVFQTVPAGFNPITPAEVAVTVQDATMTVDFADQSEVPNWSIFGYVFDDLNMDGFMDSGEPVIPMVQVTLEGVGEAWTGMDGSYAFAVADTGMYTVVETDPEDYVSTTPNEVDVQIQDTNVEVDFGDRSMTEVPVDVKPGSGINPLNLRSKGVLPVAILGSQDLDVGMISPESLLLNGIAPLRWSYGDVCGHDDTVMDPEMEGGEVQTPDGYQDLTLKFSTQEIAATLGEVKRGDIVPLIMSGTLVDGAPVSGEETVWIVQAPKQDK
ncbi:MAG: SdrD B-like domain-containing protein [Pseudomonadota bacterium]|jgi:hypothetical protein